MITALVNFIRALSSNTSPASIGHAFAWGVIFGLMPKNNALWYILFVLIFFMRIQRGVLSLTTIIVSFLAPLADPILDNVGCWILTQDFMQAPMIKIMNIPFVAFTRLDNSIVIGSLAVGLMAYIPVFLLSLIFTRIWRKHLAARFKNLKIVKAIGKIPLVKKIASAAEEVM